MMATPAEDLAEGLDQALGLLQPLRANLPTNGERLAPRR